MFALVDGNNFYVSCERAFNPSLIGKPVIVLSNNDGCAIARSNEAKDLGIKMGAPYFQIQHLEITAGLIALSPNFALYGDMSERMMSLAASLGPTQEIYSIDESFIELDGVRDVTRRAWAIRDRIARGVGRPFSLTPYSHSFRRLSAAGPVGINATRRPPSRRCAQALATCSIAVFPPTPNGGFITMESYLFVLARSSKTPSTTRSSAGLMFRARRARSVLDGHMGPDADAVVLLKHYPGHKLPITGPANTNAALQAQKAWHVGFQIVIHLIGIKHQHAASVSGLAR